MHLVYYSPVRGGSDEGLKRAIKDLVPEGNMQTFHSPHGLELRLRQPLYEPIAAILFAATRKDLLNLVPLGDLLESTAVILILPDRAEETIRMGHRLRPRFLSFADAAEAEVSAVLEKMVKTAASPVHILCSEEGNRKGA